MDVHNQIKEYQNKIRHFDLVNGRVKHKTSVAQNIYTFNKRERKRFHDAFHTFNTLPRQSSGDIAVQEETINTVSPIRKEGQCIISEKRKRALPSTIIVTNDAPKHSPPLQKSERRPHKTQFWFCENLSEEQERKVKRWLFPVKHRAKLYRKNYSLTTKDFATLKDGGWLNNSIIDAFLLLLRERYTGCFFFGTHFILNNYRYKKVKLWSGETDIFAFDKIFFPINHNNNHWLCAVVFMKVKKIKIFDSLGQKEENSTYAKKIFQYLKDEHRDTKQKELPCLFSWQIDWQGKNIPKQENSKVYKSVLLTKY